MQESSNSWGKKQKKMFVVVNVMFNVFFSIRYYYFYLNFCYTYGERLKNCKSNLKSVNYNKVMTPKLGKGYMILFSNTFLILYASLIFTPPTFHKMGLRGWFLYLWVIVCHKHNFRFNICKVLNIFHKISFTYRDMILIKSRLSLLVQLRILFSINCDLTSYILTCSPLFF